MKREQAVETLRARWPEGSLHEGTDATGGVAAEISARMRGTSGQPLSLLRRGTPFQTKVWQALLTVPEGRVCTYRDLAHLADAPGAAQAVGAAMAANPIGYLIPCHRVIRASGAAGDYQWGTVRKEMLLATETLHRLAA